MTLKHIWHELVKTTAVLGFIGTTCTLGYVGVRPEILDTWFKGYSDTESRTASILDKFDSKICEGSVWNAKCKPGININVEFENKGRWHYTRPPEELADVKEHDKICIKESVSGFWGRKSLLSITPGACGK